MVGVSCICMHSMPQMGQEGLGPDVEWGGWSWSTAGNCESERRVVELRPWIAFRVE